MAEPQPQPQPQPQGTEAQLPAAPADPQVLSALAALMATEEDKTIFRRFDKFNLLNLLILQDEIQQLIDQFKKLRPPATDDAGANANAWYMLVHPLANRKAPAAQNQADQRIEVRRREVWAEIKPKLREYNVALMELARLRSLEPPSLDHIKGLRHDLDNMVAQSSLCKDATSCWDADYEDDVVVIRGGTNEGRRLSMWVKLGIEMCKWELWGKHTAKIDTTSDGQRVIALGKKRPRISKAELARKHAFVSRLIMALFGGIALILPTVVMAKVKGINISLITTSVAVLLFGLALAFGATDSTGKDVLAATAAYTAVLVVFVGTSLSGAGNPSAEPGLPGNTTGTR